MGNRMFRSRHARWLRFHAKMQAKAQVLLFGAMLGGVAAWTGDLSLHRPWLYGGALAVVALLLRKKRPGLRPPPPPASPPATMLAFRQMRYGTDVAKSTELRDDVPVPSVGPDEVLVRVHFAAADPVDYKAGQGRIQLVLRHTLPYTYGQNFAGVVVKTGAAVPPSQFAVGDRVCGLPTWGQVQPRGTFAEYVSCPAYLMTKVPTAVTLEQAAGTPLVGCTAFQGLHAGGLRATDRLLVLGGSTSVGLAVIQAAKLLGCRDIAVTSTQEALCTRLGATRVINYRNEDWATAFAGDKVDFVFDCMGEVDSFAKATKHVLKGNGAGRFVTITRPNAEKPMGVTDLLSFVALLVGRAALHAFTGAPSFQMYLLDGTQGLDWLLARHAAGEYETVVDPVSRQLPPTLDGFCRMVAVQAGGKAHGKLVMNLESWHK